MQQVLAPRMNYLEWIDNNLKRKDLPSGAIKGLEIWRLQFQPFADAVEPVTKLIPKAIRGLKSPSFKQLMEGLYRDMVEQVEREWAARPADPVDEQIVFRNRCSTFLERWIHPAREVPRSNDSYWAVRGEIIKLNSWISLCDGRIVTIQQYCNMGRRGVKDAYKDDFDVVTEGMFDYAYTG